MFDYAAVHERTLAGLVPAIFSKWRAGGSTGISVSEVVTIAIATVFRMLISGDLPYKKLDPRALALRRAHPTDAGLDMGPLEAALLAPGQTAKLPTGIAVGIPAGFMGLLVHRSSAKERGLAIVNVIDSGYIGDLQISVTNIGSDTQRIEGLKYLAQLVVLPCALLTPKLVDELAETPRGSNGFGSTGA